MNHKADVIKALPFNKVDDIQDMSVEIDVLPKADVSARRVRLASARILFVPCVRVGPLLGARSNCRKTCREHESLAGRLPARRAEYIARSCYRCETANRSAAKHPASCNFELAHDESPLLCCGRLFDEPRTAEATPSAKSLKGTQNRRSPGRCPVLPAKEVAECPDPAPSGG
jgi:hypothetical protein